jgi:glucokinase
VRTRTGRLVGRAVASVAALLDLPLAVIAGSVALGYGDTFFTAAQAELTERARLDHARGALIRPAGLGADGPLVGAAAVGWRGLGLDVGVA